MGAGPRTLLARLSNWSEFKVCGAIGNCNSLGKKSGNVAETEIGQGNTNAWSMGGIDEAGKARDSIERHVSEVLAPRQLARRLRRASATQSRWQHTRCLPWHCRARPTWC